MWRKLTVIALAVLLVTVFAGTAMASGPDGYVPALGERGDCHGTGVGALVKVSGPFNYSCNGEYVVPCNFPQTAVDVRFKFHASVAQWLKLSVNATRIDWKVIKPGDYHMPTPIVFRYKSNGDLIFHARGFSNLKSTTENDVIDTYFRFKGPGMPMTDWILAPDVNCSPYLVPEDQSHNWYELKMNQRIVVGDCVSACEYEASGVIRVILAEQKCWMARRLG